MHARCLRLCAACVSTDCGYSRGAADKQIHLLKMIVTHHHHGVFAQESDATEQKKAATEAIAQAVEGVKTEVPAHERDVGFLESVSQAMTKASNALQTEIDSGDRLACLIDVELSSMAGPLPVRLGTAGVCTFYVARSLCICHPCAGITGGSLVAVHLKLHDPREMASPVPAHFGIADFCTSNGCMIPATWQALCRWRGTAPGTN